MNFRPYTKEDKLEVGTKIRLAGREGEIYAHFLAAHGFMSDIRWNVDEQNSMYLDNFTFEIEDIPPKPITIDKRVKEWFIAECEHMEDYSSKRNIIDYLDSLEEV